MKQQLLKILNEYACYLILAVSVFLMGRTIAQYAGFDLTVGFLALKQDYLEAPLWLTAFYVHVFSSIFTLLAGVVQFSRYIQTHHKRVHRLVGLLYVVDVLFINVPTGLILAIYANGYLPSKTAFLILDSLWFWFTLKALLEAKRRNFVEHRRYMIRSYALTFSAVTLRGWKFTLNSLFDIDPMTLYMIDAWLGFVPNLIVAEWLISDKKKRDSTTERNEGHGGSDHGDRHRREADDVA